MGVLGAEHAQVSDLVNTLNKKHLKQLETQHVQIKQTLEAHLDMFRDVLEAAVDRWSVEQGLETGASTGSSFSLEVDGSEMDRFSTVAVPLGTLQEQKEPVRSSVPGANEDHLKRWRSEYNMQKLKDDFDHRQNSVACGKNVFSSFWDEWSTRTRSLTLRIARKRLHFRRVNKFVGSNVFQTAVCCLILMNALFIGISSDHILRMALENYAHGEGGNENSIWVLFTGKSVWIFVSEAFFTSAFLVELVLRLMAYEGEFFVGPHWGWNLFDMTVTLSSIVEVTLAQVSVNFSHMRVVRITRLLRSFRVFHFLQLAPFVRSLRLMMLAIVKSVVPFIWAVLILLIVIFVFSVVFVHGVAEYVSTAPREDPLIDEIRVYLGSMAMTLLTMFMSISGGVDWWTVAQTLLEISTVYLFIFLLFILLSVLAVMNIITGIFVKEALEMASRDHDLQLQLELEENRSLLMRLKKLFREMDTDGTGCVSIQDFENYLQMNDVRVLFSQIGLEVSDALSFFKILDVDGSNELGLEEFVMGCMRFKGRANRMDLEVMLMDTKKLMRKLTKMHETFYEHLLQIDKNVVVLVDSIDGS